MKTIIYDKRNNKYYKPLGYRFPRMGEFYLALSGLVVCRRSIHKTNTARMILKEVARKVTTEFIDIKQNEYEPLMGGIWTQ